VPVVLNVFFKIRIQKKREKKNALFGIFRCAPFASPVPTWLRCRAPRSGPGGDGDVATGRAVGRLASAARRRRQWPRARRGGEAADIQRGEAARRRARRGGGQST